MELTSTVTRITFGHPLISVDLPVYDLPCGRGASIAPVLRNCVIAGLASFAPMAKCTASFTPFMLLSGFLC